jgi:putative ABC transport system permease protein
MWTITLRDLQYRGRQFGIAVAGAALVFALALLLTGISAGFRTEARDTVGAIGADSWVVERGSAGPFTSQQTFSPAVLRAFRETPGVRQAEGLVKFSYVVGLPHGDSRNVTVFGHDIGHLGDPSWGAPRTHVAPGRAVVDERLGAHVGDVIRIGALRLRVADVVEHRTLYAGTPIVYTSLADARRVSYTGRPLSSTIVVRGSPKRLPRGYAILSNAAVQDDILTPLDGATTVIDTLRLLMWIVAALIIGAVTYLSALERARDFAVLKAVGGSSRDLALSLAVQAVIASLLAAAIGAVVALALRPAFPVPVSITSGSLLALPLIAALVGVLSSLAALRRAVRVDPALAFG